MHQYLTLTLTTKRDDALTIQIPANCNPTIHTRKRVACAMSLLNYPVTATLPNRIIWFNYSHHLSHVAHCGRKLENLVLARKIAGYRLFYWPLRVVQVANTDLKPGKGDEDMGHRAQPAILSWGIPHFVQHIALRTPRTTNKCYVWIHRIHHRMVFKTILGICSGDWPNGVVFFTISSHLKSEQNVQVTLIYQHVRFCCFQRRKPHGKNPYACFTNWTVW